MPQHDPALIETAAEIDALVERLGHEAYFGFDTEFIGEQTYVPRICLVQVATREAVVLLDPMNKSIDLSPFWDLIAGESIEKVVHAGQQDLEPVMRFRGKLPRSIFDTQIAAAFAGVRYPSSLGGLISELLHVELGQGTKFSQWDRRPLTAAQLRYAANDVRYLPRLREVIQERLVSLGNEDWAREECASLSDPSLYRFDPRAARRRMRGREGLSPGQDALLLDLLQWRDEAARTADMPPRALLRDELLIDLTRSMPRTTAELASIRGLPRPVRKHWGDAILDAIERNRQDFSDDVPNRARSGRYRNFERERREVDKLWEAIRERCQARQIDPAILTSKKELGALIKRKLYDGQSKRLHRAERLFRGWRRVLLDDLLDPFLPEIGTESTD